MKQRTLAKEVEIVGEIQKSLLSSNKKEPFPLAGVNIPAKVISGDFYNFNDLGDAAILRARLLDNPMDEIPLTDEFLPIGMFMSKEKKKKVLKIIQLKTILKNII